MACLTGWATAPFLLARDQLLTDLERAGICVDTKEKLPRAQQLAESERESAEAEFLGWAAQFCEEAKRINLTSDAQVWALHGRWVACTGHTARF